MIEPLTARGDKRLRGSHFTDIMPENLSSQLETQAFAYALGIQIDKLCACADGVRIYAAIELVPEKILDVLAVELRTPAYNQKFPLNVKRQLVAGTIPFYCKLGTPEAVKWIIQAVFGEGGIQEWYEYGGEPHHFRIHVTRDHAATSLEDLKQFLQAVYFVKRLSSWLDEITTTLHPTCSPLRLGGTMSAVARLPAPEEQDRFDFRAALYTGGIMSVVTCIPVPEQPDNFLFRTALRTGGKPSVRTRIPVPEA